MGCDIHPLIEVNEYDNWWEAVAIPPRWRNYELFGLLAGVRGQHSPWVEPREFPEHFYNEHITNGDHTPSWFTLEEAEGFKLPDSCSYDAKYQWNKWLKYMRWVARDYKVTPDKVRVVFNFDT